MDYETALLLKKAGFPQPDPKDNDTFDGSWICECSVLKNEDIKPGNVIEVLGTDHEKAYAPTTDELIEELGNDIKEMYRYSKKEKWFVSNMVQESPNKQGIYIEDKILVKALACLYIALHSKS